MWIEPEGRGDRARRWRSVELDADGRARAEDLVAGRYRVALHEAGLVSSSAVVDVAADAEATASLAESSGGSIDVLVVDGDGRPLPFASLDVGRLPWGLEWLDVSDEGVQRLDRFTDHLGRRALEHVEPGEVEVTVRWGSRSAKSKVAVSDGDRAIARFVLPAPRPP